MSKKRVLSVTAICTLGLAGLIISGCHAEAHIGNPEPKAATPPPPPPAPPPPPPAPAKPALKAMGKAKIVNNKIEVPGKVHFATDKATIQENAESKEVLESVQKTLEENKQITKLLIAGHTDNKGTHEHNMTLSQQRADAVQAWLVSKGISKDRLMTKGYGPDKPIADNDTDEHREQNRRTEFTLWEVDGQLTDAAKSEGAAVPTTSAAAGGAKPTAAPGAAGAKPAGTAVTPKK
jgi:outer membrane protein OmpA-like peptidoglycan-associated protein